MKTFNLELVVIIKSYVQLLYILLLYQNWQLFKINISGELKLIN